MESLDHLDNRAKLLKAVIHMDHMHRIMVILVETRLKLKLQLTLIITQNMQMAGKSQFNTIIIITIIQIINPHNKVIRINKIIIIIIITKVLRTTPNPRHILLSLLSLITLITLTIPLSLSLRSSTSSQQRSPRRQGHKLTAAVFKVRSSRVNRLCLQLWVWVVIINTIK